MDETEVKRAIEVILSDKKAFTTSLNWAISYCRAAREMSGKTLKGQCLYILNNITHWRHPAAKDVRNVLRSYSEGRG